MIYYHRVKAVFDYLIKTTLEKIEFTNYEFDLIRKELGSHGQIESFVYSVADSVKSIHVELNICSNGVIFGFLINKDQPVEDPEYLSEKELIKYVDLLMENKYFYDQSQFTEAITVREMSSIPAGANPYNHDSIRMGCDIGQNWQAMFYTAQSSEEDFKPSLNELVLINTKTGRRFHLDLTKANELPDIKKNET